MYYSYKSLFRIGLLLMMNLMSAKNIVGVLVPQNTPGWQMFEFPAGTPPEVANPDALP